MQIEHRFTAMAYAMARTAMYARWTTRTGHPVARLVADSVNRNQGLLKVRGWNANLSFKTAQKLKNQGVIPA